MNIRPLRYLGYAALALAWLAVMVSPCLAITLVALGEVSWQRGDYDGDRLWLIQERDYQGLGYSATRVVSDRRPVDGPVCVQTRVRFFLWRGSAPDANTDFCECYAPAGTTLGPCP